MKSEANLGHIHQLRCSFISQQLTIFTKSSFLVAAAVLYQPFELTIWSSLQMFASLNQLPSDVIYRLLKCCYKFCDLFETIKQSCGFAYKNFIHEVSWWKVSNPGVTYSFRFRFPCCNFRLPPDQEDFIYFIMHLSLKNFTDRHCATLLIV